MLRFGCKVLLRVWLRTERPDRFAANKSLTGAIRLTNRSFILDINAIYAVREPDVYKTFMLRRRLYMTWHGPQIEVDLEEFVLKDVVVCLDMAYPIFTKFRMMYYGKQMCCLNGRKIEASDAECLKIQEYIVGNRIIPVKSLSLRMIDDCCVVKVQRNKVTHTITISNDVKMSNPVNDKIYNAVYADMPNKKSGQTIYDYAKIVVLHLINHLVK